MFSVKEGMKKDDAILLRGRVAAIGVLRKGTSQADLTVSS